MFIKHVTPVVVDGDAVTRRAAVLLEEHKSPREVTAIIKREFGDDVVLTSQYTGLDRPGGKAAARRLRQQPRCEQCGDPVDRGQPLCSRCLDRKWR